LVRPWANVERWTLKPGQTAVLRAISIGIAADDQATENFEKPIGSVIVGKPGKYRLRYELRFNAWERKGPDGQGRIPGDDDWQGTISTGITTIGVRERRPEDEPPTFTARLRFNSPDGQPVEAGHVQVQVQSRGRPLLETELTSGPVEVPNCPFEALTVYVQAPGFEETRFFDVAVKPDQVTTLSLPRAEPVRFRLVTRDGKPVAGAEVRYFNRSKMEASAGPYPMAGLNGTVWSTSSADGQVVLDMLQKEDPLDRKLGNNIYWFYVEPPRLASLFLGPLQAGAELGDVVVGPLLEVSGEVRGTPEELAAFSAEWDQPEPMKRGNGEIGWYYAESTPLEAKRDGDKLTFHLTGLRPGKLRIVSRFKQGGKPINHVYSRREPNEDDVVFEVELTESQDDLVIANQRQHNAPAVGPTSAQENPDDARRQEQERSLEAQRQDTEAVIKEQERHTEARREALRAEIEQAVKQGDQAAAERHWAELISLPEPPARDCRQAIQHFEQRQDWSSWKWHDARFSMEQLVERSSWPFYALQALGLAASLTEHGRFGDSVWREQATPVLLQLQGVRDGSWQGQPAEPPLIATSMAILFLTSAPTKDNSTARRDPPSEQPDLIWGPPTRGLQAAVEFLPQKESYAFGDVLGVRFHIRNVSDQTIRLSSELARQDDHPTALNKAGQEQRVADLSNTNWPQLFPFPVKPGQEAVLDAYPLGIYETEEQGWRFKHTAGNYLVCAPGRYMIRYAINLGNVVQKDAAGTQISPAEGDWVGTVDTGPAPIVVRRQADDILPSLGATEAEKPPPVADAAVEEAIVQRLPEEPPIEIRVGAAQTQWEVNERTAHVLEITDRSAQPVTVPSFHFLNVKHEHPEVAFYLKEHILLRSVRASTFRTCAICSVSTMPYAP
jgi:hypothetical protein